ncbi:MAG: MBL fold metallo-hydrolase [Candidatus Adiutrix sp.]|jgi:glyoxylase-like metal-dependent hydrolase (beta-lactamase superfamily II)|nr:MBL fold metallo-hydrolase [Candidatus Adiutrix sp.]
MLVEFIHGDPNRPEFGEMFGGWLTSWAGRTFLIDCGVVTGGPSLTRRVKDRLGDTPLDFVLLTHIHLDHAGGLADLARAWPDLKVLAHEKGIHHLVSPERLWAGTREVMGELAEMYGRPEPLEQDRFIPHPASAIPGLTILETPGHAVHHLSFRLGPTLFIGEAGGCPYFHEGRLLNRPATPPRYFPELMDASIHRLLREPDELVYAAHTHEPVMLHECLRLALTQLSFWDTYLRRPEAARRPGESDQSLLERLVSGLFAADPYLRPLNDLPPVDLWRERYFLANSITGFLQYYRQEALEESP